MIDEENYLSQLSKEKRVACSLVPHVCGIKLLVLHASPKLLHASEHNIASPGSLFHTPSAPDGYGDLVCGEAVLFTFPVVNT